MTQSRGVSKSIGKALPLQAKANRTPGLKIFNSHRADFVKIFYAVLIADLRRYHDATYQIFILGKYPVNLFNHLIREATAHMGAIVEFSVMGVTQHYPRHKLFA